MTGRGVTRSPSISSSATEIDRLKQRGRALPGLMNSTPVAVEPTRKASTYGLRRLWVSEMRAMRGMGNPGDAMASDTTGAR